MRKMKQVKGYYEINGRLVHYYYDVITDIEEVPEVRLIEIYNRYSKEKAKLESYTIESNKEKRR